MTNEQLLELGRLVSNISPGKGIMRSKCGEYWLELSIDESPHSVGKPYYIGSSDTLDCCLNYVQPLGQNKYIKDGIDIEG